MKPTNANRPSLITPAVSTLIGLFFAAIFTALPDLQRGKDFGPALRQVLTSPGYWTGLGIGLIVIIFMVWLVIPFFFGWIRRNEGSREGDVWKRYRLVTTIGMVVFLVGTAIAYTHKMLSGETVGPDQCVFIGAIAAAYLALLIYLWAVKPSSEKVRAIESGDSSRLVDERYQLVQGRSAVTTVYSMMLIILTGGGLYDVIVTRMWPARSLVEVILIFVIWNIAYAGWNKKL